MDQTGAAFVEAVEPYGPGALLVVGIGIALVAVLCAFVLPTWRKNLEAQQALEKMKAEAQIKLESEREKRKAHEAEQQAETDAKTAVLMEGMKTSIDAMNTTLTATLARVNESGNRSSKMGETVEDTNRLVTEIHHAIVK